MNLKVYWSRFAEYKLDDIFIYYETKAGENIAKRLVNGIIDHTIGLENNPEMGQVELLLENYPQNFRYLILKNYKIIYWINLDKKRIEISTIFDTRQNPKTIFN